VTGAFFVAIALSAVLAVCLAGLYLAWPREMTAEEWVLHRRDRSRWQTVSAVRHNLVSLRLAWTVSLARADLRLLQLQGGSPVPGEAALAASLVRLGAIGAGAGLAAGLAIWLLAGRPGLSGTAVLMPLACAALLPGLRWLSLRRRAALARLTVRRRLPRILGGARVLLESGAATPQGSLSAAVALYHDVTTDVLREALLQHEVRRVELQETLDAAGEAYGLHELRQLADAYRMGTRHGTQMADLLAEFAGRLRHVEHAAYRERMTRAPVLMAVPALVFFVLPLIVLLLLLVLLPLEGAFAQL
jgi:Flp pilus assembly protein TadB